MVIRPWPALLWLAPYVCGEPGRWEMWAADADGRLIVPSGDPPALLAPRDAGPADLTGWAAGLLGYPVVLHLEWQRASWRHLWRREPVYWVIPAVKRPVTAPRRWPR